MYFSEKCFVVFYVGFYFKYIKNEPSGFDPIERPVL